jgi:hypothetical protein
MQAVSWPWWHSLAHFGTVGPKDPSFARKTTPHAGQNDVADRIGVIRTKGKRQIFEK